MATKHITALLALLIPSAAFAQSAPPKVCLLGVPCVVDSKGAFVGVGAGPVMHVFGGVEYMLDITAEGVNGPPLFYWPAPNCKGPPLISDEGAIRLAMMDPTANDLYAAGLPVEGLTATSYSYGLNGACGTYATISNVHPLFYVTAVDSTVAKTWVPPFSAYKHH
jgi:hypothetical protein